MPHAAQQLVVSRRGSGPTPSVPDGALWLRENKSFEAFVICSRSPSKGQGWKENSGAPCQSIERCSEKSCNEGERAKESKAIRRKETTSDSGNKEHSPVCVCVCVCVRARTRLRALGVNGNGTVEPGEAGGENER